MQKKTIKALTILELLVVIAIIGIFSVVAYPNITNWIADREVRKEVYETVQFIKDRKSEVESGKYGGTESVSCKWDEGSDIEKQLLALRNGDLIKKNSADFFEQNIVDVFPWKFGVWIEVGGNIMPTKRSLEISRMPQGTIAAMEPSAQMVKNFYGKNFIRDISNFGHDLEASLIYQRTRNDSIKLVGINNF